MRTIMTATALCALMVSGAALAQTSEPVPDGADIYRNDLPETHDGISLPPLGTGALDAALDDAAGGTGDALSTISAGSVAAQQFGNLAASKHAGGVVRDLGDVMILLHSAIDERLDAAREGGAESTPALPQTMNERDQAALNEARVKNDQEFNLAFSSWVADAYPGMIEAWRRLGEAEGVSELAEAIVPRLEAQLRVAEQVVAAEGDLATVDAAGVRTLTEGGGGQAAGVAAASGAEGQAGERQHTPEPEPPAVQTGENYRHEQVETDPQTQTQAAVEDGHIPAPAAAGDLEVINSAGLLMALDNPENELAQLEDAPDFGADRVRVVPAQQVMQATELAQVETAMGEREADIRSIRAAIEGNEAISDAMDEANASVEDVIALDVIGDGAVIYTWTR
jgi:Domain of unknown function (DUF4142)